MACAEFSAQLAIFRELSPAERERLQAHLATCPDCQATLAVYMEQDCLLSALPTLRPSARLTADILARTIGRRRLSRAPAWRWASVALVTLLVFLAVLGVTIGAAAEALPGDVLYPVKRAVEQVRLTLTFDPTARESYERLLTMTRLEEARKVLQQGREADVEFQGPLEATTDGEWSVGGIAVQVPPEAWDQMPPQPGVVVAIKGRAAGGQLSARRVSLVPPKAATPTLKVSPTASPKPSPTAMAQTSPTATPKEDVVVLPTLRPSVTKEPKPLPSPSWTPDAEATRSLRRTWTPRIVPLTRVPTPTPRRAKPTFIPSDTPEGGATSTPRGWRTPLPWPTVRPSRLPSYTPRAWPTRTPRVPAPTPRPTWTPEMPQPTPSPVYTPRVPVHTPKPSPTPRGPDPTPTPRVSGPSLTATLSQDQPWPTSTPVPPTPTPRPTHTPLPPTATPAPPTSTPGPTPTPTCPRCYTVTPRGRGSARG